MPKNLIKKTYKSYLIYNSIFGLLLVIFLTYYNWLLGIFSLIFLLILTIKYYRSKKILENSLNEYIETLNYKIKKVGSEVIQQFPIGIVLYDDENNIEWHNQYINIITDLDNLIGKSIKEVIPNIVIKDGMQKIELNNKSKVYELEIRAEERLIYITDITDYTILYDKYENNKPVFGIIHLDNLDEVSQGLDELTRSLILTDVTSRINDWALEHGIFLRRFASDKFFMVTNNIVLKKLENNRFDILDIVREMTLDNKIPLTLSIGIGAEADSLIKLGERAQSSLDISLGRGGDQAAVKFGERLSFYGGKSNAVEKRTRVRARVISHAMRDLIKESDIVLIMGHKTPDMDALGSSIGVLKSVLDNDKDGYIILDEPNQMIDKLLKIIAKHEELPNYFITPEKAMHYITKRTLLIVVDTHRPSLTIEPKIVEMTERVIVIDHHRRSEEIIEDSMLFYIEPYASSTSELVTELLQYQNDNFQLDKIEATALLAGIVVDTRNFAYRTGTRTFEAASFLRANGADPILVQKILKEDLEQYIKKAEIIKKSKILYEKIAIVVAQDKLDQILIAKTADTLLNISGISASFVISVRKDGLVSISARSYGTINVQVIMEKLGGGGHLTNAAVQIENITLEEAEARLIEVLENVKKEGGLNL